MHKRVLNVLAISIRRAYRVFERNSKLHHWSNSVTPKNTTNQLKKQKNPSFWHKSAFFWHKYASIACQSGARAAVVALLRQFSRAAWIRLDLIELRLKQIQSSNSNLRSKIRIFVRRLKLVRRKSPPQWVSWVTLDEIQVELFASQQQHIMQLYCSKHLNNAFRFFWKAMGLAYASPPFCLLANVLTKIAFEGGRVVIYTPDWGCSGEHAYWCRMLDRMTVGRVQLPDGPIYVPEDSDTAMQAPEWASFLSIVDGSLNPVPLCDLDQVLLKEVMAENHGLTLSDLKERSPEHLSATLTECESPDGTCSCKGGC